MFEFSVYSKLESKKEEPESSPIKNHLKSPEKSKPETEVEEGEITSEEEPLDVRRKKERKQRKERKERKSDKRQRIVSLSEHSNTDAVSINGVKEVRLDIGHPQRSTCIHLNMS